MDKIVTKEVQARMGRSNPQWDYWTFRKVIRVTMKDAFYKQGDVLKIKWFGTFGCFDHKDRWVDYYDIGEEIPEPKKWED